MGRKHRWRISLHRSSSRTQIRPPSEFICPISGSLMADPVIVSSGQTFERNCIHACKEFGYTPQLHDGTRADLSSVITNFAIKSTILNWCDATGVERPRPLDFVEAKELVRRLSAGGREQRRLRTGAEAVEAWEEELLKGVAERPPVKVSHSETEVNRRRREAFYSSSDDSRGARPLDLARKPACCSSSSSSAEFVSGEETLAVTPVEDEIVKKLRSGLIIEQEEGAIALRRITKTMTEERIPLCSARILAAMRPLLVSKYTSIQVNTVAALVNLSLEKMNKVRIVRGCAVPALIDVLKGGSPESQEHAAGAIFSLAMEDENKTAIGVLGAIPPLLHLLMRSENNRAREDSAMALYHLTLVQANRLKLVKLGGVPPLLSAARDGAVAAPALIILCNLAASREGRAALLDAHAVQKLVVIIREAVEERVRENCVTVLYALSQSRMRFKGSAGAAGAAAVLVSVAQSGSERERMKARRMLLVLEDNVPENCLSSSTAAAAAVDATPLTSRRPPPPADKISGANSADF